MSRRGSIGGLSFLRAFVVLQAGTWFAMSTSPDGWQTSWRQAVDNGVGTVEIIGPLLAGLVAGTYAALGRTSFADLVLSSERPRRGWFGPAAGFLVAAVLSLLVLLVVVTLLGWRHGVPLTTRAFVIVPVGLLVLVCHALLGMVIGVRASPRVAAVLAAFFSFGLFLLAVNHLAPPSFVTGGVTGPMYGEQYRLGSILLLCGFAVASAVAVLPWVTGSRQLWRRRATVSGVAGLALVALAQQSWPDLESRLESAAVSYQCGGSAPVICMVRDRPNGDLVETSRRMGAFADPLGRAGAVLPERWQQDVNNRPVDGAGRLSLSVPTELGERPTDQELVRSLTMPAGCPAFADSTEPEQSFYARNLLTTWIGFRNGLGDTRKARPWFSSAASERWVRTTYSQLRRCDLDAVHRP